MFCRDFERLVALHVEGDLQESEQHRVDAHLRACASCRELAEDLKESQSVFKSLRQDVPDRGMLSSVRARVLNDVAGMGSGGWFERILFGGLRQKATLAGIALTIVGGSVLWFSQRLEAPVAPPPPIAFSTPVVPKSEPLPQSVSRPPAPRASVRRTRPAIAPTAEEPHEQLTIKLLTDDPNVIIYWLFDGKGD